MPNRQALRFLGIAVAVSAVLAFPMELVRHSTYAPGSYWLQNSCGGAMSLLNAGLMLQAILAPLLVFLLPGAGGIFQRTIGVRSLPAARALARPEEHGGARSRRTASTVEASI